MEKPNEGDIVKVPDPLPRWWWKQSADAPQRCQREAKLWHQDLHDYRHDEGPVETPTAVPDSDDSTTESSETHQEKTMTPQVDLPRSTAALTRSWVLDSGSAHHFQDENELTQTESDRISIREEHILEAVNGDRAVNEHYDIQLPEVGLKSSALAMPDCPSLLSVGQLIDVDGFRQLWDPELGYMLQDPGGQ
eukprot:3853550-Pyramimonas_sp.AAC.1